MGVNRGTERTDDHHGLVVSGMTVRAETGLAGRIAAPYASALRAWQTVKVSLSNLLRTCCSLLPPRIRNRKGVELRVRTKRRNIMRRETIAIHGGYDTDPTTKAVAVPIYQTVAYEFD